MGGCSILEEGRYPPLRTLIYGMNHLGSFNNRTFQRVSQSRRSAHNFGSIDEISVRLSIMRLAAEMLTSICIVALGLFLNTLALAALVQPMVGRRSYLSSSTTLGTASGGALDPLATHPPAFGPKPAFAGGPDLTINVVNSFGSPLSIFYGSNAGAPTPIHNPGSGTLSSSTQVLFPSGWAGRITIGGNFDPKGSKIEASYSSPNYVPDVDISYVDGYSVPITCSCYGVAVTGCNSKPRHHILSA